jgi:FMN reductase
MSELLAVAVSGSPSPTSSSRRLAEGVLRLLADTGYATDVIDLASLPAGPLLARGEDDLVREALARVERAKVIVVATPVYRATYTGLLKTFFDLMPESFLVDKACIPIATAAAPGHLLAVDHGLRPLVASLGGLTTAAAIFATPDAFVDGDPSPELEARMTRAAAEAVRMASAEGQDGAG